MYHGVKVMLGIINYGMGNLASVQNALNYLNLANQIIVEPSEIKNYDKLILPGVGAFGEAIGKIKDKGFFNEIQEFVITKQKPILGICLGMQLLLESSTEHGYSAGLGLVKGKVNYLGDKISTLPLPHVGWNSVAPRTGSVLFHNDQISEWTFYFVHSYYCDVSDKSLVTGKTTYGFDFDVAFESGNVFGVQFHPEKSQKNGLALLTNFGKI
jgi:glutamine amidotransferase